MRVHEHLKERLLGTVAGMSRRLGVSAPTVTNRCATSNRWRGERNHGRRSGRVFVYDAYLNVPAQGTEPL